MKHKHTIVFGVGLTIVSVVLSWSYAQGSGREKIAKLAPPTSVRVAAGENAAEVTWDPSPDGAKYELAGYNVYFDGKSAVTLSPDQVPNVVEIGKNVRACVVRGLENGKQYFFHVRSRHIEGGIGPAGLPEQEGIPQTEGKNYGVAIYDDDVSTNKHNSGYGWLRENGQGMPGYKNVTQHGKYVDVLMTESPTDKKQSVLISPAEVASTQRWPYRNRTLIADIGTTWVMVDSLPAKTFATSAAIKVGHVYVLKAEDVYCIKLRIDSIQEVNLLLPFGGERRDTTVNKVTFTYVSQLDQSYSQFLTGK